MRATDQISLHRVSYFEWSTVEFVGSEVKGGVSWSASWPYYYYSMCL